jgi:predicted outer membrane repeat protein
VVNFKENRGKYGGAIFLQDDALVRLNGTLKKVDNNGVTIEELNRINLNFLNNEATVDGGMLFAVDAMFDMAEAEAMFSGNIAYDDGGAMYILGYREYGSRILFSDTITHFINNSASNGNGGAIFIKNSSIKFEDGYEPYPDNSNWVINNVDFSNNTSKQNGGAIYSDDSFINFDNGDVCFASNITQEKGGALFLSKSNAFFEKNKMSVFKDNKAIYGDGGAIYISTNSLLIFSDKVINENSGLGEINIIQFINKLCKQ